MTLFPNIFGGDSTPCRPTRTRWSCPKQPTRRPGAAGPVAAASSSRCSTRARPGPRAATCRPGCRSADSDEYKKLTPQSNYAAAADAAVYDPDGWYSGSGSNFEIVMGSAIGAVLRPASSPPTPRSRRCARKLTALANTAVADLRRYRRDHHRNRRYADDRAGRAADAAADARRAVRRGHGRPAAAASSPRSSSSTCCSSSARRSTAC